MKQPPGRCLSVTPPSKKGLTAAGADARPGAIGCNDTQGVSGSDSAFNNGCRKGAKARARPTARR
jgi:hypothetical protein